jgi:SOS-response transcriptional repressor LexA
VPKRPIILALTRHQFLVSLAIVWYSSNTKFRNSVKPKLGKSFEAMESKQFIDEALDATGFTVDQLANRLGIKERTLKRIRSGEFPLSEQLQAHIQTLVALVSAMGPKNGVRSINTPRGLLKRARERADLSLPELAQRTGYQLGVLQAVEDGSSRASEKMIDAICRELPDLSKEELMGGSDHPLIFGETEATYGLKPQITLPPGTKGRYVPLLSWAQAGALDAGHVDDAYDYTAVLALDVHDPRAFALEIRGNSMSPEINEGDRAIVCPTWQPHPGDTVIARTIHGDVYCKLLSKRTGDHLVLASHNSAHPPIELSNDEIAWLYPVGQVTKNLRRE